VGTDVSGESTVSNFRIKELDIQSNNRNHSLSSLSRLNLNAYLFSWLPRQPWRWKQYNPPNCLRSATRLHGVTYKMASFMLVHVRASDQARSLLSFRAEGRARSVFWRLLAPGKQFLSESAVGITQQCVGSHKSHGWLFPLSCALMTFCHTSVDPSPVHQWRLRPFWRHDDILSTCLMWIVAALLMYTQFF
jgi:hypothetical protein